MKNVSHFFSIAVSLLIMAAAPAPSFAQTTSASSTPATNISNDYSYFLAKTNSQQVVNDLRNGRWTTTVTDPNTKVTTTSTEALPTGKMGFGNVKISLALAQESLRQQGIMQPTSEQLHTALVGDSTTAGILQMRADGMGWGQIAQKYDVKLGQLMSGKQPASSATTTTTSTSTTSKGITTANGKSSTNVAGKANGKTFSGSESQESGIVTASGRTSGTPSGSMSQAGRGIVSGSGRSMGTSGIVTGAGGGHQYSASGGGNGNAGGSGKGPK